MCQPQHGLHCASAVGVPPQSARGLWGGMKGKVAVTQETDTVFLYCVGARVVSESAELN